MTMNSNLQLDTQLMVQGNNNGMLFNSMTSSFMQQKAAPRFDPLGSDSMASSNQQGQLNMMAQFKLEQPLGLGGEPTPLSPNFQDDKRKFLDDDILKPFKKQRLQEVVEAPSPSVAPMTGGTGISLELEPEPDEADAPAPVLPSKEGMAFFGDNDVLSGRGGGTNVHPGNRNFRDLINHHRRAYLKARKNDKPAISRAIVRSIRKTNGKFLKKDDKSGLWFEIGDDAAREKTSQALRQRAPEMRKLLFDTEREEARVAAEEHIRQQRMLMNSMNGMQSNMMGQNNMNMNVNMNNMGNMGNMMGQGMGDINSQAGMMNPALLQAMAANTKNLNVNQGSDPQFSQMLNAALLQGGINRFASNGA